MALHPFPGLFSNPGIIPQSQGNGRFAESQLLGKDRNRHKIFTCHAYPALGQRFKLINKKMNLPP
jgi:hypothetical protein